MSKMHTDEAETDANLVRRLLRAQFPQWADLPITRPEPADVMRELEEILHLRRPDGEQEQRPPESGS